LLCWDGDDIVASEIEVEEEDVLEGDGRGDEEGEPDDRLDMPEEGSDRVEGVQARDEFEEVGEELMVELLGEEEERDVGCEGDHTCEVVESSWNFKVFVLLGGRDGRDGSGAAAGFI